MNHIKTILWGAWAVIAVLTVFAVWSWLVHQLPIELPKHYRVHHRHPLFCYTSTGFLSLLFAGLIGDIAYFLGLRIQGFIKEHTS